MNTYGAFGSITRTRYEVVVEGTAAAEPDDSAVWREYEFKGKPGDPMRRPPQIAPYHLRLDWQMWFAAMGPYEEQPWFVNFAAKLLKGDRAVAGLLRENPFAASPPRYCARGFTSIASPRRRNGARPAPWWQRRRVAPWFPEVSLDTPGLREVLRQQGWE